MLKEFWLFVANVLANWQATVTGGCIGVAILLIEHWTKKSLTWRALWYLLAFGLFMSCFLAWHDEHRNSEVLIMDKADVTAKLASCAGDLKAAEAVRRLLNSQAVSQQGTINTQQSTVNTCVVTLAKMAAGEPERVYVWPVGIGIIKQPIVTELVVVTTRPEMFRGNLECEAPFQIFDWTLTSAAVRMGTTMRQISPTKYHLGILSPIWEPTTPIVVNVLSKVTLSDCKFSLGQ
jgi:hypothetical protein